MHPKPWRIPTAFGCRACASPGGSATTADAVDRMKPLFIDKCPFVNPPNIKKKIQWVQPRLVCEIVYAELTADDQITTDYLPRLERRQEIQRSCARAILNDLANPML
ncbi:MAG: hypothetical protein WAK31_04450 [Chthoniobacterales bacterium]